YGGPRLGYMGHITLLTKSIVQIFSSQPDLKNKVIECDDSIDFEQWDTFAENIMNELQKLELPLVNLPSSNNNSNDNSNQSSGSNESQLSSSSLPPISTPSLTSSPSSASSSVPFYINTPTTSFDTLPGYPFLTPPPPVHSPTTSTSSTKVKLKHV
ncbi:hypothetical protein BJ944DRAFT_234085, partial [Cunninghamella echinulata]